MSERRVWIAQCLCGPKRHAMLAAAGEADDQVEADESLTGPLRVEMKKSLMSGAQVPWCGICLSPAEHWIYEARRTAWTTMDEARAPLREIEMQNMVARTILGGR